MKELRDLAQHLFIVPVANGVGRSSFPPDTKEGHLRSRFQRPVVDADAPVLPCACRDVGIAFDSSRHSTAAGSHDGIERFNTVNAVVEEVRVKLESVQEDT